MVRTLDVNLINLDLCSDNITLISIIDHYHSLTCNTAYCLQDNFLVVGTNKTVKRKLANILFEKRQKWIHKCIVNATETKVDMCQKICVGAISFVCCFYSSTFRPAIGIFQWLAYTKCMLVHVKVSIKEIHKSGSGQQMKGYYCSTYSNNYKFEAKTIEVVINDQ